MKKITLLILVGFVLVYILPLGVRPMILPDETRYGEIPREMIATGDWVTPKLNGLRYFEKPVMGYWLNALSMEVFGENAFAIRFPSGVSVGLSALFLFFLCAKYTKKKRIPLIATVIFLTCIEVFGVGVFSVLDSMVAFFMTSSLVFFFLAWHHEKTRFRKYSFLILSGICCGMACHTKGFLAFVVPVSIIVPFLIWEGKWKEIFKIPWIPLGVAFLVMLPWGLAIHFREPDFWNFFFWNEHVRRFLADDAQHKNPFYYFFLLFPLGIFPWTVLVPASILGAFKSGIGKSGFLKSILLNLKFAMGQKTTSLFRFALCWFLFPFLFFSASSGKLLTYILPCFPAFSILMALGLDNYFQAGNTAFFNKGARVLMGFPVVLLLGLAVLQQGFVPAFPNVYAQHWKIVLLIFSLVVFLLFLNISIKEKDYKKKIVYFALAPLVFYFSAHYLLPDFTIQRKSPVRFLELNKNMIQDDTLIASTSTPVKSVCWAFKRNDVYLLEGSGELSYGLEQPDSRHRRLCLEQFSAMIHKNRGVHSIALVTYKSKYEKWRDKLPKPSFMAGNGERGYVLVIY